MTVEPHPEEALTADEPGRIRTFRALRDFDAFFRSEYRAVAALTRALSGSRLAADDLAQDAFIAAQRNWARVGRYDKPEAWVRRVATNMAVSHLRRLGAEARAVARLRWLRGELSPALSDPADEVWRAVRRLPTRQAQVVALTYLDEYTTREVAAVLEIAEETVRTHLRRAHASLAQRLGDYLESDT